MVGRLIATVVQKIYTDMNITKNRIPPRQLCFNLSFIRWLLWKLIRYHILSGSKIKCFDERQEFLGCIAANTIFHKIEIRIKMNQLLHFWDLSHLRWTGLLMSIRSDRWSFWVPRTPCRVLIVAIIQNWNYRTGTWRRVHSKAVCTTCAIGSIITGAEHPSPPPYITRNSNTVCRYNPCFKLLYMLIHVICDACCDGKIKL